MTYVGAVAATHILLTGSPEYSVANLWDRIRNRCQRSEHGTFFILSGWILVGLPAITLGDKILRMNLLMLTIVAGTGDAV